MAWSSHGPVQDPQGPPHRISGAGRSTEHTPEPEPRTRTRTTRALILDHYTLHLFYSPYSILLLTTRMKITWLLTALAATTWAAPQATQTSDTVDWSALGNAMYIHPPPQSNTSIYTSNIPTDAVSASPSPRKPAISTTSPPRRARSSPSW